VFHPNSHVYAPEILHRAAVILDVGIPTRTIDVTILFITMTIVLKIMSKAVFCYQVLQMKGVRLPPSTGS